MRRCNNKFNAKFWFHFEQWEIGGRIEKIIKDFKGKENVEITMKHPIRGEEIAALKIIAFLESLMGGKFELPAKAVHTDKPNVLHAENYEENY